MAPATSHDSDRDFDERFAAVLHEVLDGRPEPAPDTDLIESEILDSFDLLQWFMAIEDEFGAMWPMERMTEFRALATIALMRDAARKELWKA